MSLRGKYLLSLRMIIEFVGLKSKMFSLVNVDGKENKKGKGVKIVVVENIKYKIYCIVLINKKNNGKHNEKNLK